MLNVVAGTDPDDPATALADSKIPGDWRTVLDVKALRGKRIGYVDSAWADVFPLQSMLGRKTTWLTHFNPFSFGVIRPIARSSYRSS